MKYMTSNEIRNMWLNFFKSKGHHVEEGASLVPNNDPTLLWINAGVTPLKNWVIILCLIASFKLNFFLSLVIL